MLRYVRIYGRRNITSERALNLKEIKAVKENLQSGCEGLKNAENTAIYGQPASKQATTRSETKSIN